MDKTWIIKKFTSPPKASALLPFSNALQSLSTRALTSSAGSTSGTLPIRFSAMGNNYRSSNESNSEGGNSSSSSNSRRDGLGGGAKQPCSSRAQAFFMPRSIFQSTLANDAFLMCLPLPMVAHNNTTSMIFLAIGPRTKRRRQTASSSTSFRLSRCIPPNGRGATVPQTQTNESRTGTFSPSSTEGKHSGSSGSSGYGGHVRLLEAEHLPAPKECVRD